METLEDVRSETRKIDDQLIELIIRRTELGEKTIELKRKQKIELYDERHILEVLRRAEEEAKRKGIDPKLLKKIFEILIEMRMMKELRKIVE
jgi:chorismate mutase